MTNERTKQASRNLSAYLRFLPPEKRDSIHCLANALCAEQESLAFIAGLQLGAQLKQEVMEMTQEQFEWLMSGQTILPSIRKAKPKNML